MLTPACGGFWRYFKLIHLNIGMFTDKYFFDPETLRPTNRFFESRLTPSERYGLHLSKLQEPISKPVITACKTASGRWSPPFSHRTNDGNHGSHKAVPPAFRSTDIQQQPGSRFADHIIHKANALPAVLTNNARRLWRECQHDGAALGVEQEGLAIPGGL